MSRPESRCGVHDLPVSAHPDAGRRRRARRGLAPDGVQRRQQPRPAARRTRSSGSRVRSTELGYSPNRAARNLRTRTSHLIGLRVAPVQEGTANALMDRFVHSLVETSARPATTCCSSPATTRTRSRATTTCCARPRSTPSSSPTPTSATRRPPGSTSSGRRSSPSAGRGTDPERPPPVGRRRRGRRHPSSRPSTSSTKGHERIAWIGWRKDSPIGEDRRAGWLATMHEHGLPTTGLASRVEDTVAVRAARRPRCCSTRREPTAFVCASDTLAMGVLHTLRRRAASRPASDIAVVGFDDSQVAQVVPAGADLGAPAARGGRGRDRQRARGPARPTSRPPSDGVLLTPTLVVRESS